MLCFAGATAKSKNRLDEKVVIVTGANTGIGYETALELTKRGAQVVLACRDPKKGQQACDQIMYETSSKSVFFEQLDLSSFESIRKFNQNFRSKFNRLDILINNAGLVSRERTLTKDGFETSFGVMHLGHFLLTGLLIDMLKASAPSRIINVSSIGHRGAQMKWDDLQSEKDYNSMKAYVQAKLCNCLFTIYLSKKYGDQGITSVSLHPGAVRSDIWRVVEEKKDCLYCLKICIMPIAYLTFKDNRHGAQTTIHCALDDSIPKHNGVYFDNCKPSRSSPQARDETAAQKLWEISEKLTGISY